MAKRNEKAWLRTRSMRTLYAVAGEVEGMKSGQAEARRKVQAGLDPLWGLAATVGMAQRSAEGEDPEAALRFVAMIADQVEQIATDMAHLQLRVARRPDCRGAE